MSNTPRTDAATVRMERLDGDIDEVVSADFARQLERELIAAQKTINQITLEWEPAPSATAATDFFNFLESAAQDIDYNPEGGGELSGVEAVLEFLHEPLVYEVLNRKAAPVEAGATDCPDWAQQLPGAELYDRDHGYDRSATLNAGRYVCTCGACPDAQQPSHTTGEKP